jgi:hypothetical protein
MRRRDFLRSAGAVGAAAVAGCSGNSGQQSSEEEEDPVRYFFEDETGALGHLESEGEPENNEKPVTNTVTEEEYQEMQLNDIDYARQTLDTSMQPAANRDTPYNLTADEIIQRTQEIFENPLQELSTDSAKDNNVNLRQEDDEITFTRALVKAAQESGITSSAEANGIVSNLAETAIQRIQPGFTDYKLTTLMAAEAVTGASTDEYLEHTIKESDYGEEFGTTGLSHSTGLLQYQKNGETKVKYAEQTNPFLSSAFRKMIRDPEDSMYHESLENEQVNLDPDLEVGEPGTRFPEHYVTPFDYTKARQLEAQDKIGLITDPVGNQRGLGDEIAIALTQLVSDENASWSESPDKDYQENSALDGALVSDQFGQSIEQYITNPDTETRQYMENTGRAIFQAQQAENWDQSIALTGTLEDPEILITDHETINQIREEQAYDQVRERIAG